MRARASYYNEKDGAASNTAPMADGAEEYHVYVVWE